MTPHELAPNDRHFWVPLTPFFDGDLVIGGLRVGEPTNVSVFDPDGELVNELSVAHVVTPSPSGSGVSGSDSGVVVLALRDLAGSVKIESGLVHIHFVVHGAATLPELTISLRQSRPDPVRGAPAVVPEVSLVTEDQPYCAPLTIAAGRAHLVALVGLSSPSDVVARLRLIRGNRAPETTISVPPSGARLVSLAAYFPELLAAEQGTSRSVYLRLTVRSGSGLGVVLLERAELQSEGGLFRYGLAA